MTCSFCSKKAIGSFKIGWPGEKIKTMFFCQSDVFTSFGKPITMF